MKVKMLDSETGVVWPNRPAVFLRRGEIHDVPDHVAEGWISMGLAAPVVAVADNAPHARKPRAVTSEE